MRIFIILSLCLWSVFANAESRFALVIGNSAYPAKQKGINDLGTLTNPKNDAEDVSNLLKGFGFILTDHQGENKPLIDGTKQQMDDAIDKFLEKLSNTPDAIAWFYYSGHGVYLKDLKRPHESANYLLPIGQNFSESDPAKIKYNAVNAHLLKDRLQNMGSKDKLMILDTCRDKLELSKGKGFSGGEEFRPMDPEHGLMVVHATLHSYSAFENPNKERNGNFTKQLLLALKQQSTQRISRAISVGIEKLKEANQLLDPKYRQHPRVEGILSQDFCLADCQTNLDPQIQAKQKELDELEKKLKEKELALATPSVETSKPIVKPTPKVGESFKDCPDCPEMVMLAGGTFKMGSERKEAKGDEKPVHEVSIKPFAIGKYEITKRQFAMFVTDTGYKTDAERTNNCYGWDGLLFKKKVFNWDNVGFKQTNDHPVVCVSWKDAINYTAWLNKKTGKNYHLPTEAEWEYSARAGTTTTYFWGDDPNGACEHENISNQTKDIRSQTQEQSPYVKAFLIIESNEPPPQVEKKQLFLPPQTEENQLSQEEEQLSPSPPKKKAKKRSIKKKIVNCQDGYMFTALGGSFEQNKFSLHDMLGNVREWTCSDYQNYIENNQLVCSNNSSVNKSLRGGSWSSATGNYRSATRFSSAPNISYNDLGFRIVLTNP